MKLSLLGDIALHGLFVDEPERNFERLKQPAEYLSKSDMVFANLEAIVDSSKGTNPLKKAGSGGVILRSNIEVLKEVLPYLNIGMVSLANNHVFDFEEEGLQQTLQLLDSLHIKHTGAGLKPTDVEPCIISIQKKKIVFMAYVDISTNPKVPENRIFVNYVDVNKIIADINKVKDDVDIVVVSLHWGIDYSSLPTKSQTQIAKTIIDAGAHIIMGHHAHNLQPYEPYKHGHIFYGLGSLCFGDYLQNGKRKALRLATKKSVIADFYPETNTMQCIKTKEKKGNTVYVLTPWKNSGLKYLRLSLSYKPFSWYFIIKNVFIDRFIDFFFGYYRHPIKELLTPANWKKARYLIEDFMHFRRR